LRPKAWFSVATLFLLTAFTMPAFANTQTISQVATTQNQVTQTLAMQANIKTKAASWGLKTQNYKRYLWLMKNTPSGHWYKHLDPAEVLALNANNPQSMMKYARIQARNMHVRVTRELAFDQLYTQAYKKEYPNEKAIRSPGTQGLTKSTLASGDHVWLFVGVSTPLGSFAYQHLIKAVQAAPNTTLDIYFVGKNISEKSIQAWAVSVGILRSIVNKQVTLNYGNDRFQSLSKGKKVNLPFVGIVHDEHFQPITLSSVL
jgi:integrating conjugative element protein (TIGR03759 family)